MCATKHKACTQVIHMCGRAATYQMVGRACAPTRPQVPHQCGLSHALVLFDVQLGLVKPLCKGYLTLKKIKKMGKYHG
jgi:hypothetical protein